MIKRFFIYLLLINYLIAIIGFPVSIGYCGKKIQEVVIGVQTHKCQSCKKTESKSCCNDSVNYLKLDVKQNSSNLKTVLNFSTPVFTVISSFDKYVFSDFESIAFLSKIKISPPEKLFQAPIYLKNRSFLI